MNECKPLPESASQRCARPHTVPPFRGLRSSTPELNLSRVCHKKTPYTPYTP